MTHEASEEALATDSQIVNAYLALEKALYALHPMPNPRCADIVRNLQLSLDTLWQELTPEQRLKYLDAIPKANTP